MSNTKGAGFDFTKKDSLVIAYTSLDFSSLLSDLEKFEKTQFSDTWTDNGKGSFEYMWLHTLAYIGDLLAFSVNTGLNEMNVLTCKRMRNFLRLAPAFNFYLPSTFSARVRLRVQSQIVPYVLPATTFQVSDGDIVFMPEADTLITDLVQFVQFVSGILYTKQSLGLSSGAKSERFAIEDYPVVHGSLRVYVGEAEWTLMHNVNFAKNTDLVYFTELDETGHTDVFFGDGINGKIPPLGAEIRATYRVGGGKKDNLPKNTITTIVTPFPGVISVTNPDRAESGEDIATLGKAKTAIAGAVTTNLRAVTRRDHVDVLFDPRLNPPPGVEKASVRLFGDVLYLYLIASNGTAPSDSLKSEISKFFKRVTVRDIPPVVQPVTYVNLKMTVSLFVDTNYNAVDLYDFARRLFITESGDLEVGLFDYSNLGLGGRDDQGTPQLTVSRVQQALDQLRSRGLQKASVDQLTTTPVTKTPIAKPNNGNGGISAVTVTPASSRREFVIRWKSPTLFDVYQRIVGTSTFLTDAKLLDDRLNIAKIQGLQPPDNTLYPGSKLNPNRAQTTVVPVNTGTSTSNIIEKDGGVNQTLFALAATGDEYYVEFVDSINNVMPGPVGTELLIVALGNVCTFLVTTGTIPFKAGDELSFDLYPLVGDILLREDEMPRFFRDGNNVAVDLTIIAKTAE